VKGRWVETSDKSRFKSELRTRNNLSVRCASAHGFAVAAPLRTTADVIWISICRQKFHEYAVDFYQDVEAFRYNFHDGRHRKVSHAALSIENAIRCDASCRTRRLTKIGAIFGESANRDPSITDLSHRAKRIFSAFKDNWDVKLKTRATGIGLRRFKLDLARDRRHNCHASAKIPRKKKKKKRFVLPTKVSSEAIVIHRDLSNDRYKVSSFYSLKFHHSSSFISRCTRYRYPFREFASHCFLGRRRVNYSISKHKPPRYTRCQFTHQWEGERAAGRWSARTNPRDG